MKKTKHRGAWRSPRAYTRTLRLLEITAREMGHNNERRVVDAYTREVSPGDIPTWIQSVRISSQEEDRRGIDVVFVTDVGEIFVQVKGSSVGIRKFEMRQQHGEVSWKIITIIVFPSHTPHEIRQLLTPLLWKEYSRFVFSKKNWQAAQKTQ